MDEMQRPQEIGGPLDLNHRMRLHFEQTRESPGLSSAEATGFLTVLSSLDSVAAS
jgi:hypothetical protein